jgi:type I restriction enzyme, S subunit
MEFNWISTEKLTELLLPDLYQKKYISNVEKIKKSCLPLNRLASISTEIRRGKTPKHEEFQFEKSGLLLKTTNIRENEIDTRKLFYAKLDDIDKTYFLQEGDICITIMGATEDIIGRSWTYNSFVGKATFSDAIARIKGVKIDPYYLSTFLNSSYGKLEVRKWSGSSTRSYVTNTRLGNVTIPIPSPEVQKYIGGKVRKAEKLKYESQKLKIESERLLAQAFNSDSLFSGHAGQLALKSNYFHKRISNYDLNSRIDARYYHPTKFISLKIIQENNPTKLKDLIVGSDSGIANYSYVNLGIPLISTSCINNNVISIPDKNVSIVNIPNKKYLSDRDVLITTYGATSIGKADVFVNEIPYKTLFDYTLFRLKFPNNFPVYYFSLLFRSSLIQSQLMCSINSGGGTNFLNSNDILDLTIPNISNHEIIKTINDNIRLQISNIFNSQKLIDSARKDVEELIEGNFEMKNEYMNLIDK